MSSHGVVTPERIPYLCFIMSHFFLFTSFLQCLACLCCQVARHSHTAVEWTGNMVIFGGELANGSLASDVWMYRPLQDDWQQLGFSSSHGAPKLANHAAAVVDNYLYVFGGGFHFMSAPFNLMSTENYVLKQHLSFSLLISQVALRRICFPPPYIGSACMVLGGGRIFSQLAGNHQPRLVTQWSFTAHPGHCWCTEVTGLQLPGTQQYSRKSERKYRQFHVRQHFVHTSLFMVVHEKEEQIADEFWSVSLFV